MERTESDSRVDVEVLYFDGCPHVEPTVARIREVVAELNLEAEVREVEVRHTAEADELHFLGSSTVRVNGSDLAPDAAARTDYALGCRLYGGSGIPPREMVVAALRAAGSRN